MTKKSKQILVDSVVVIDAHENHYWESLCNTYQIALPATVIEEELFYFHSDKGKKGLRASSWVESGRVIRIEASLANYEALRNRLCNDLMAALDRGEQEALAIVHSNSYQNLLFTTADRAAVKTLGVLGMGQRGISVEELLNGLGNKPTKRAKLPNHFSKKWFQQNVAEGFSEQNLWLKPRSGK